MRPIQSLLLVILLGLPVGDAHAAAEWPLAAVGIIGRPGTGGCSGALIAPDIVLTAAHCLTGARDDPSAFSFRTGAYPGIAATETQVLAVAVHPLYEFTFEKKYSRIRFDLALARLASPVDASVQPLVVGTEGPETGERLLLASYRGGQGSRARERRCEVFPGVPEVATIACEVAGGESGSPVIRTSDAGMEIVAVLSSRSQVMAQPIGLVTPVQLRIDSVFEELDSVERQP